MKKNLIALAVAAAVAPGFAAAEGASVSGFADIKLMIDNDKNYFLANGEVDFRNTQGAVTVGVDADLALAGNDGVNAELSGPHDSAAIEQAFFAWGAVENLTILGGVFNNPIGLESEDVTGLHTASHGQIYGILDGQTALYGNNIAGLAAAYNAGPATITAAVLNDLGHTDLEEVSLALVVNFMAMEGLDLELGYVTQEDEDSAGNVVTAGNVVDFNATFTAVENLYVGFEYLAADNVVDSAIGLTGSYMIMDGLDASLRYDVVSYEADNTDDTTSTTVAVGYKIADNLKAKVEWTSFDNGDDTDDSGQVKFIATF